MEPIDQVLKTLLEIDEHQGNYFGLKYTFEKYHPDLTREELLAILERLEFKGLIRLSARKTETAPILVKVNSSAYRYYKNKQESELAAANEKAEANAEALMEIEEWEERQWNIKLLLFGFIGGFAAGVGFMWLRETIFR